MDNDELIKQYEKEYEICVIEFDRLVDIRVEGFDTESCEDLDELDVKIYTASIKIDRIADNLEKLEPHKYWSDDLYNLYHEYVSCSSIYRNSVNSMIEAKNDLSTIQHKMEDLVYNMEEYEDNR